jgi:D-aspartate ligase
VRADATSVFGSSPSSFSRARTSSCGADDLQLGLAIVVRQRKRLHVTVTLTAVPHFLQLGSTVETPIAFVLGSLSLIRPLGRAGVPIAALVNEANRHLSLSRYVAHSVPVGDDPIETMVRFACSRTEPPVLFFEGDDDLTLVSRNRDRLAGCFRFALPPPELVENLVDKKRFAGLAARHALPVPATRVIAAGEVPSDWRHFPCILKPAVRTHWFGAHLNGRTISTEKALRAGTREELETICGGLQGYPCDFILQELVEGGEEHVVSYHAYVRDGVVVADFTGRKVRTTPRAYGFSSCVEITDEAPVRHAGRDVLERIGFSGVVKLDFKEEPRTGRLHLLEANPRFNLWHHPGAIAGVNLPLLVYRDLVAPGSVPASAVKARAGVRWMSAALDLRALDEYRAAGELTTFGWLRDLAGADIVEDMCWRDPLPGVVRLLNRMRQKAR